MAIRRHTLQSMMHASPEVSASYFDGIDPATRHPLNHYTIDTEKLVVRNGGVSGCVCARARVCVCVVVMVVVW